MRLLKRLPDDCGFDLVTFSDETPPPYAILSHTWVKDQEVTYEDFKSGTGRDKIGYNKIQFCSMRAAVDGLEYFWIDTCCINKATMIELTTAINWMFRWYQGAAKCYVYLNDVSISTEGTNPQDFPISWRQAFRHSRWFTRGWTLQELLAPTCVEFYSEEGRLLGDRASLKQEIHNITRIPMRALSGQYLDEFSIETVCSWVSSRRTTVKEDKVYCLLGFFGVFLPPNYGEGESYAMSRLKEEIEKRRKEASPAPSLDEYHLEAALEGLEWKGVVNYRFKNWCCTNCGDDRHKERSCRERCGNCMINTVLEHFSSWLTFIKSGLFRGHTQSICDQPVRCVKCEFLVLHVLLN